MRSACTVSLLLCLAPFFIWGQQDGTDSDQPTLTVRSTLVQVPVLVKNKAGRVVFELTADDFVVTDNGVRQKTTLDADSDSQPLALAIVVETGGAGVQHLRDYGQLDSVIDALIGNVEHRVTVIGFDSAPHLLVPFSSRTGDVSRALAGLIEGDNGGAILDGIAFAVEHPTGRYVYSSPAVANGIVYFGSEDQNVYALNANTGAKLWSYTTDSSVDSSPAVSKGVVYIGSFTGNVYALKAKTGAKLWSHTTGSWVLSSPAVANGVAYVGSQDGKVYALNAKTGAEVWSYTARPYVYSSPVVANGVVYFGSDDYNVYALNANTGAKLWSYATGNSVDSGPSVADGEVYISSEDGKVYVFALKSISAGTGIWGLLEC